MQLGPVGSDFSIPAALYEAGFHKIIDRCFSLFRSFYVNRPADERGKLRHIYINYQRGKESEKNQLLQQESETAGLKFLRIAEGLRYDMNNVADIATRKSRYLYHEEKQFLNNEEEARQKEGLSKRSSVGVRARVAVDRFSTDKWLQICINSNQYELEKLIRVEEFCTPEEAELYQAIESKLKSFPEGILYPLETPGLFDSKEQKMLYEEIVQRRKQLVKDRLEAEKKLIFGEGDDFPIIHSNLGLGGRGSSRGPYGVFTAEAILHLKNVAKTLLERCGIKNGQLRTYRKQVEELSKEDRLTLLMNTFVEVYGSFQQLRFDAFEAIRAEFIDRNDKQAASDPEVQKIDDVVRQELIQQKRACQSKLQEKMAEKKSPRMNGPASPKSHEATRIAHMADMFFTEVKGAYAALDDFLLLLEIRLDKDFTVEEKEKASLVKSATPTPTLAPARASGSIILTPNRMEMTLSKGGPAGSGSKITSIQTLEQKLRLDDFRLLKGYLEIFQAPLELLDLVNKAKPV